MSLTRRGLAGRKQHPCHFQIWQLALIVVAAAVVEECQTVAMAVVVVVARLL